MLTDIENWFANELPLTTTADGAAVDLGSDGRLLGNGGQLWVIFDKLSSLSGGATPTLNLEIRTDDDKDMLSSDLLYATSPIQSQVLQAQGRIAVPLAIAALPFQRHLGVRFTVANGAFSGTSAPSAYISLQQPSWAQKPSGLNFYTAA